MLETNDYNYRKYMVAMNRGLQKLGNFERKGLGGKKIRDILFPGITSYYARHTWATVGRYCHIPIEVISEGLGHASVTTTEGYMKGFGNSRMDRANKVIMNYIFKGLSNAVDKW